MTGRVIIVTGASSGLGYETARYLCEGGNDVILACRDEEKATRAIEKIKQQNPNALATYMHVCLQFDIRINQNGTAARGLLLTPRYYLSTYGRRAFSYAGPSAWNSLPEHLRAPDLTLNSFRHSLKTFLFTQMTHAAH